MVEHDKLCPFGAKQRTSKKLLDNEIGFDFELQLIRGSLVELDGERLPDSVVAGIGPHQVGPLPEACILECL
jgi:hypothetical protein